MNCNLTSKTPRITRGNDFKLLVPLREYAVDSSGGKTEQDLELGAITEVNVIKSDGSTLDGTGIFTYERVGSTSSVLITFGGGTGAPALANGKYGIEIIGTRSDGSDFRFYKTPDNGFVIVESTDEGYVPADTIMTYTVDGVVGVAQNVSSGGGGGSATVGTLNTTNETAQIPSASESFGGTINLHKVSKTGSYNDLRDKPTIPAAQVQADWNATSGMGVILNKPDVSGYYQKPTTGIPLADLAEGVRYLLSLANSALQRMVVYVSYANNAYSSTESFEQIVSAYEDGLDVVAIYDEEDIYRLSSVDNNAVTFERAGQSGTLSLITITSSDAVSKSDIAIPDISGKEDRLAIETTIGTTAEMGMYYRLTTDTALTVNLPEMSPSAARLEGFIVCLTIATGGSVTFVPHNQETIILQSGLDDIADGKTYEINAVWNGEKWAITATELTTLNAS